MNHAIRKKGFTLVELMLAMSFVSVLLLAIALTIMQIGTTYNRGMTTKEMNQAARGISEDFRYNIAASASFSPTDGSFLVVRSGGIDAGARLCLGTYSYIWNYGRVFETAGATPTRYDNPPAGMSSDIRLVRVNDSTKAYCAKQNNSDAPVLANIRSADTAVTQELLRVGDRNLAVYQFAIVSNDSMYSGLTDQRLYHISFTIGSGSISAMSADQTRCLLPGEVDASRPGAIADVEFCVVQQFSLVIRTGNKVN